MSTSDHTSHSNRTDRTARRGWNDLRPSPADPTRLPDPFTRGRLGARLPARLYYSDGSVIAPRALLLAIVLVLAGIVVFFFGHQAGHLGWVDVLAALLAAGGFLLAALSFLDPGHRR